ASRTAAAPARHAVLQKKERLNAGTAARRPDLAFCRPDDRPLDASRITRRFGVVLARAGLPHIRVHDLRHTAASLLLVRGVHPKVVQEMLGHSSISLTLDTYSHLTPSLHVDAAHRMDELFPVAN